MCDFFYKYREKIAFVKRNRETRVLPRKADIGTGMGEG